MALHEPSNLDMHCLQMCLPLPTMLKGLSIPYNAQFEKQCTCYDCMTLVELFIESTYIQLVFFLQLCIQ